MSDFKSMREASIKGRLSKLSYNAGPKSGNDSHKVAVVEKTGPSTAAEFLKSEGTTTKPRSDRAPRKCGGRAMKKDGGKVKHDDEAEDRAMVEKMVKSDAMTGKKEGGRAAYASGGAAKPKGSTTINIVMPPGDKQPMPVPIPMGGGAPASAPTPAPRPAPAPQGMQGPGVNPTLNLNRGGRAAYASGGRAHFTAGAGSGEGRLEKTEHEKGR